MLLNFVLGSEKSIMFIRIQDDGVLLVNLLRGHELLIQAFFIEQELNDLIRHFLTA